MDLTLEFLLPLMVNSIVYFHYFSYLLARRSAQQATLFYLVENNERLKSTFRSELFDWILFYGYWNSYQNI
jgi:hypothetical protein